MKVSVSWLNEYIEGTFTVDELVPKLFSCGLEVEEVINKGKNINKIVFCKIKAIDKHPNADKLSVTTVDAGSYGIKTIVTNGKNIKVGDIVPVALDGATLDNNQRIFKGELRGVMSDGMFCSGQELGIGNEFYDGAGENQILVFKEEYPLGEEVKKALEIEDTILDINVTANRPDCQSIIGIAREAAAVLGLKFKMPDLTYKCDKSLKTTDNLQIIDNAFDLCPRYIGHYVQNIKIGPSPKWMTKHLASVGIRSINNIVDITNYVLTEIGQPMHAFDYDEIGGKKIIIRRATDGEKITTLDEKEFALNNSNLVICDSYKPVALAGIMGGLNSEIKSETNKIVFECATFKRDNIRRSSRQLGQSSDSSKRFEKGIDRYTAEIGMNRALNLISTLNIGTIACDRYDLLDGEIKPQVITAKVSDINAVLGIEVPEKTIINILEKLDFKVESKNSVLKITVPLYREDVFGYPDIAEEVIREYGYDNIQSTLLKTSKITLGNRTFLQEKEELFKNLLTSYGFNEIITYSFVAEKDMTDYGFSSEDLIKLVNPISEDMAVMRLSLIPSIINIVVNNLNRKNFEGRLFEIANVYNKVNGSEMPSETKHLSIAFFGNEDFYTAKGVIESFIKYFIYDADIELKFSDKPFMHPTRSAYVYVNGELVGLFGQLHPIMSDKIGIEKPIIIGEFDYNKLQNMFSSSYTVKPVSKFPQIERDLAIVVDKEVTFGSIEKVVKNSGGEYLQSVKLFDIYEGLQVGLNKKSVAFNMIFSATDRTLTVEEIEVAIEKILNQLKTVLDAKLR